MCVLELPEFLRRNRGNWGQSKQQGSWHLSRLINKQGGGGAFDADAAGDAANTVKTTSPTVEIQKKGAWSSSDKSAACFANAELNKYTATAVLFMSVKW